MTTTQKEIKKLIKMIESRIPGFRVLINEDLTPPHWKGQSIYNQYITTLEVPVYLQVDYEEAINQIVQDYGYSPDTCLQMISDETGFEWEWEWMNEKERFENEEDSNENDDEEEEDSNEFSFRPRNIEGRGNPSNLDFDEFIERKLVDEFGPNERRHIKPPQVERPGDSSIDMKDFFKYLQESFNEDDLSKYINEKYYPTISNKINSLKVIGHDDCNVFVEVDSNESLDNEQIKEVIKYLKGQFSDGWGEGFEQNDFRKGTLRYTVHTYCPVEVMRSPILTRSLNKKKSKK